MITRAIAGLILALSLAGCGHPQGVTREEVEGRAAELGDLTKSRIVTVLDEPYLAARKVPIAKSGEFTSGVFARRVSLNYSGTLAAIAAKASRLVNTPISVDPTAATATVAAEGDLDAQLAAALGIGKTSGAARVSATSGLSKTARVVYDGPFKGLLDVLSNRFGLAWEYGEATGVIFAPTAVRTFTIWAAPGDVSFSNSITNASKDNNGGTSGVSVSSSEMDNDSAQTNKTSLNFDVWKDIEAGVTKLLSPAGSVVVNQGAGTVTVRDSAAALARVGKFIETTNETLARQIALSIKVWSLEVSDTADIGLSLSMFFENPDVRVFAGSASSLPSFSGQGGELSAAVVDGKLKDSTSLLKALRSVGHATQVTSGGGVIMNNQPIPIQAVRREAYLASSSTTIGDSRDTTTLTPGEVTTGFAMTVVPHILEGRRVVLQYTVNLSSLDDITEFASGENKIQLPKVSTRSYSQRMTLKMGQTLVLAGFEQEVADQNTSGGLLGVGRGQSYKKSLMVITISTESGEI